MIKILIVDDSQTEIQILKKIFESEPDMEVIGYAYTGKEAIHLAERLNPDLITMDIQMPEMDGVEATRLIMSQHPTPIVVISSKLNTDMMHTTFRALEAGALSVLEKPINVTSLDFEKVRKRIVDTVRSMAEIKVIKRRFYITPRPKKSVMNHISKYKSGKYEIVAIGTSVGGPQVLKSILSHLPADFPTPIVVVQHITTGFIGGFVKWLNENTALNIKEAENLELLKRGTVYFAPDNYHLVVDRIEKNLVARLMDTPHISGFRPSATMLLQSVAKVCGKNAIGILLTGMGNDGAQGLLELKNAHGHTLIQDEESAVVFGMAGVAQSLHAVDKVIELDKFAEYLTAITKNNHSDTHSKKT